MLLTPQEVNQQRREEVKSPSKMNAVSVWKQAARPSRRQSVQGPLVSSDGFPLQTDNIFFQSCTSAYPQGFLNPLH